MRNFKEAPKPLYQYKGNTTKNDLDLFCTYEMRLVKS